MDNVCEIYEQGIREVKDLMTELTDANLRAAVANAAAAVAIYPQEKTAQALIRCMRAHVQCQREEARRAAHEA